MTPGAIAVPFAALAALAALATAAYGDADRVRGCMAPAQAHETLIEQKFIAPFRAMRDVVRGGQGDAVGVQLCRLGDAYVYDITLLQRDGRVSHVLVNARTGAPMAPVRATK